MALTISASIVAIIVFAFLLLIALAYLAPAAVGMAVARVALGQAWATRRWLLLVLGVLGVVIVTSIPVLGGWLGFVIVVFGLGAFLLTANARRRRTQALPPPPMPAPAS